MIDKICNSVTIKTLKQAREFYAKL